MTPSHHPQHEYHNMDTREETIDVLEDIDDMSLAVFLEIYYPEYIGLGHEFFLNGAGWLSQDSMIQPGDSLTVHIRETTRSLSRDAVCPYGMASERIENQVFQSICELKRSAFESLHPTTNLTNPKESTMENITPVQTLTLVNGHDISRKSDDDLINDIRRLEADIKSLGEIETVSRAVAKKAEGIAEALKATVAELDSRYPAEAVEAGE